MLLGYSVDSFFSHSRSYPAMLRLPTAWPAMPATTREPCPVLWPSRIRPPAPVSAPGKGAMPHGKLWVSTVHVTS